jgi:hypothetical protein
MTPNKQKLIERLLSGSDDLFSGFVIAGLEESLEIICDWIKLTLSMDKIPEHLMDDLIGLRADGEATIRILKYYGAGSYPVASDLMAQAHMRIQAWECYLRATKQQDMSQEDDTDAQVIPALKEAQERTKGMLTEADADREMSKHFVEMVDRIEELEAKNKRLSLEVHHANDVADAAIEGVKDAEAKLQNQTQLIEQLFALLDIKEQKDDGRYFHPNIIRSSRALDAEKLEEILVGLRSSVTEYNKSKEKCGD